MAIVKMSKIRVIGLLEDKDKVYNFLQNNQRVHLAPVYDYENTTVCGTDEHMKQALTDKRNEIDKVIDFVNNTLCLPAKTSDITYEELLFSDAYIVANEHRLDEMLQSVREIGKEITDKEKLISANKGVIADILTKKKKINYQNLSFTLPETELSSEEITELIRAENTRIESEIQELKNNLSVYTEDIPNLILYREKCEREINKLEGDKYVRQTEKTFIMEFYLPEKEENGITGKLQEISPTIVSEKVEIEKGDKVPTLTNNNKVIRQAEFVTNMYSVPSYNEVDPNPLLFVFFNIFFGYIMADIGLGLVMVFVGYFLASRIKEDNGAKRLWKVVGTAGIFAIFWGILYNSIFGIWHIEFIPTIMPDPSEKAILTLLFCLLMGVIHLSAGYFMKGLNAIHEHRIMDSILDGFLWNVFFTGIIMALAKFMLGFFKLVDFTVDTPTNRFLTIIEKPGLIMALVSLGIIVLFAGRHAKGLGKLIKPFTTLYGLINILSDVLSYARLFGLMLSGAIISQQFGQIGLGLMTNPVGAIIGVLVIIIGNAFNVAMGALGAYIHDCRLQYVEYFGKFYTGEGTLFTPFTPKYKYIEVK